jgi:hypothetical protein
LFVLTEAIESCADRLLLEFHRFRLDVPNRKHLKLRLMLKESAFHRFLRNLKMTVKAQHERRKFITGNALRLKSGEKLCTANRQKLVKTLPLSPIIAGRMRNSKLLQVVKMLQK